MNIAYRGLLLLLLALLPRAAFSVEPELPAMPAHYVVDLAGIIDDGVESNLNGYLKELEQKTTAQLVVLTITSLDGESLEEFSIRTAHEQWKLGQKGKDNGALIVIALKDRQYRFEVGYGLEGILPDSLAGSIGREYLVPNFRKGDFSRGIYAATLAVAHRIAEYHGVAITGMPAPVHSYSGRREKGGGLLNTVISLLLLLGMIFLFIRHPRLLLFLLLFSSMGGGRRGGWSGGGGFGGGGSFGGGGGGGFGGGGASGSW